MTHFHGAQVLLLSALVACGSASDSAKVSSAPTDAGVEDAGALDGWDREVAQVPLADEDPAPDVVQVTLEARVSNVEIEPGQSVELWTYNGSLPGPLIRAQVGDKLRVHFTNLLPEPTTIHWHGLEVPADMDGAGVDQGIVAPGDSFDYEFVVPHAGTYWYHPHVNSSAQVWRGLYGALVVDDATQPELGAETVLVLSDISFEADGVITSPESNGSLGDFFGREGHILLVNGRVLPTLRARNGDALRLRVINAAVSRYFLLQVDGHLLTRVGGDGGLLARPEARPEVLLVPGERADIVLVPNGKVGSTLLLRAAPYSRFLCGAACGQEESLLEIAIVTGQGRAPALPSTLRAIPALDMGDAIAQDIDFTQGKVKGDPVLGINGQAYPENPFELHALVGQTQLWNVGNATDYDHPFHLHGFRFQVLTRDGSAPEVAEWKDTLNIPARSRAQIGVQFDDRPGMWMIHCHILDHAKIGMMGMLHLTR